MGPYPAGGADVVAETRGPHRAPRIRTTRAAARAAGWDDTAIHDAVLVAAAFCMVNRYVDGLGARTPEDPEFYRRAGARLAEHGYLPG